jgi:hypothetical protein
MGDKAQDWSDCVCDNNYKFMIDHPAAATYKEANPWNCKNVFNKTNEILLQNQNLLLTW